MTEKLDRSTAFENLTDPMGNTYKVQPGKLYPGLYEIALVDPKPNALPPKELRGYYTNTARAYEDIKRHLNKLWDKCEKPKPKSNTETASAAAS